jgi:trehalose 6-phosphate phosphatase
MDYLFDAWGGLIEKIRKNEGLLLLLDYDGTIVPIVERPELAILSQETLDILVDISRSPKILLGIVSGRKLSEVKRLVGIEGIYYVGNHGLEAKGPGLSYINPIAKNSKLVIDSLYGRLTKKLGGIRGALTENKGYSLTVHYRMASAADEQRIKSVFFETVRLYEANGGVKTAENKKTLEVIPPTDWNKGGMIIELIRQINRTPRKGYLPIYAGDDATDEDAFKALKGNGVTILVSDGPRDSHAQYYLKDVNEVAEFLRRLTEVVNG